LASPLDEVGILDDLFRYIFAGAGLEVRDALGPFSEALLPADGVHRSVMDQGHEEGAERAPRGIVGLRRPPQGEEGVVDHLLRERVLPGDPKREGVSGLSVAT